MIRNNLEKMEQFLSSEKLNSLIQKYVTQDGLSYSEAICEYCRLSEIDPEDIANAIDGALRDKLEHEAVSKNLIKNNTATLF